MGMANQQPLPNSWHHHCCKELRYAYSVLALFDLVTNHPIKITHPMNTVFWDAMHQSQQRIFILAVMSCTGDSRLAVFRRWLATESGDSEIEHYRKSSDSAEWDRLGPGCSGGG